MALTTVTFRVAPEEAAFLDRVASQHEGILSKQGVIRLLLQHAEATNWDPLTKPQLTQTMVEPAPRRGSSTSKEDSSIEVSFCLEAEKPKAKSNPFKHAELHPELECARETFVRFGKAKKGDRTEHGAKLAATGLRKIGEKYGWDVALDQLDLAINNRWNGISLSNYEKFLPKAAAKEPEHRHPAYRDASEVLAEQERIAQQNIEHARRMAAERASTGGVLDGLF